MFAKDEIYWPLADCRILNPKSYFLHPTFYILHVSPSAGAASCRSRLDRGAGGAGDLRLARGPSVRSGVEQRDLVGTGGRSQSRCRRSGAEAYR